MKLRAVALAAFLVPSLGWAGEPVYQPTVSAALFVSTCTPVVPLAERIAANAGQIGNATNDDMETLIECLAIVESVYSVVVTADHYSFNNGAVTVTAPKLSKVEMFKEVIRYGAQNPDLTKDPEMPAAALVLMAMADYAPEVRDLKLFKCGDLYTTKPKPGCVPAPDK